MTKRYSMSFTWPIVACSTPCVARSCFAQHQIAEGPLATMIPTWPCQTVYLLYSSGNLATLGSIKLSGTLCSSFLVSSWHNLPKHCLR